MTVDVCCTRTFSMRDDQKHFEYNFLQNTNPHAHTEMHTRTTSANSELTLTFENKYLIGIKPKEF